MIIKLIDSGASQLHQGKQKIFELKYKILDWENNGDNESTIFKELEKDIRFQTRKDNIDEFEFATNSLIYSKKAKSKGKSYMKRLGWFMSRWHDVGEIEDAFPQSVLDSIRNPHYKEIVVMVKKINNMFTKKAGEDKHNDCVFNVIFKAHDYDKERLPSKINSAKRFKVYFKYERDDKVDLFDIVEELQEILKLSIEIVGDVQYIPKILRTRKITINYRKEHVKLMCNENRNKTSQVKYKEVSDDKIYTFCFNDGSTVSIFDGNKLKKIQHDEFYELKKDNGCLLVPCSDNDDLKQERTAYIEKADYFKKISNGLINYRKCQYESFLALELWRMQSKSIKEPEEISLIEQVPLEQSNIGGVHYAKAGTYKNCTDYDMNVMYLHYMSQNNFVFPTTQPETAFFTTSDLENLKFFPYGLYNCKISGSTIHLPAYIMKGNKWHTHYVLTIAKQENLKIEMCEDLGSNVLLYSKNRLTGKLAFLNFAESMKKLCNDVDEDHKADAKKLRSCLWGALCTRNKTQKAFSKNEMIDLNDYNIDELIPLKNGCSVRHYDKEQLFKTSYARVNFITGYCRLKLYQILKDNGIKDENIVALNTDGIVVINQKLPNSLIGTEWGKFKIVNQGTAVVVNSNNISFI